MCKPRGHRYNNNDVEACPVYDRMKIEVFKAVGAVDGEVLERTDETDCSLL